MQFKAILAVLVSAAAVQAVALPAGTAKAADCAAAKKLADGIQSNIDAQKLEQSSVAQVKQVVSAGTVDQAKFAQAKQVLLGHVNDGIAIRENNQKIAPPNNAAIQGLGIVANAQKTELSQAQSLKGTKDDLATIAKLETEFAGGIKQNEQNKADAMKGC